MPQDSHKTTKHDSQNNDLQALLRLIPKIDTLLSALKDFDKSMLMPLINAHLQELKQSLQNGHIDTQDFKERIANLIPTLESKAKKQCAPTLKRVINATGVVIHTNLGRSVFSEEILDEVMPFLRSYHTLEYDLAQAKGGERYTHCVKLLREICGCEDALLVNNNAASVFLILNTFAKHKEVIISRGELIEIGGSFRIPEIMASSESVLREVGTTNKTHLRDYENAINEQSAMIMKAHQSNFKQLGFVSSCHIKELIALSRAHHLIDYFDLGSGHLGVLHLTDEPSVQEICAYKPSLLSFSGDKLLGGCQVGIICGKAEFIKKLKTNPLLRAFRVDKCGILLLQATLQAYKDKAYHKIPTLAMLLADSKTLESKANALKEHICALNIATLEVKSIRLDSVAGGGSLPNENFSSFGLSLKAKNIDVENFESLLRERGIIAYIKEGSICLDMRTLLKGDEDYIVETISAIFKEARDE